MTSSTAGPPRPALADAAVVVLLALAACGPTSSDGATGSGGATASGGATGDPTAARSEAGLDRFYEQELAFEPCDDDAWTSTEAEALALSDAVECARMEAPLDYDEPDGERVEIALLRVPARGDDPIGSLVLNAGPGGSGLMDAVSASTGLADSPIIERFDLVGFDPRGVGASIPAIDCFTDAEADAGSVPTSAVGSAGPITAAHTLELVERCAQGTGGRHVLEHLGTRDVVRDLDVLRAVLGDDQLTYLGQSDGTRLGAVYAET